MTLQPLIPGLVVMMVASIATIVWAVGEGARDLTFLGALAFPSAAVLVCFIINRPFLARRRAEGNEALAASRRNARLMAMLYAWGAAAIFAIYSLTDLWWWHSWQYGLGMAFVACCLMGYVHLMSEATSPLAQPRALDIAAILALLQAATMTGGLAFLIGSGKLAGSKPDWPANYVFIGGGLGLILVSSISAYTHRKLRERATAPSSPTLS